jgi:N-acetylglucosaminyl-diphospho-decaprenol L-rhamnosyltransferase
VIDAVIVTFDTREMTLGCVAALPDEVHPIVVDNASTDGTAIAVRDRCPHATVVRLDQPVGYAAACNRGAEAGDGPLVLILNSDIVAEPGAVERLRAALEADPGAVAAGGRMVDPGTMATQAPYTPKPFPTLATFALSLVGVNRTPQRSFDEDNTVAVDQPAGACLLVRREALEAVGGFDERFWFWYEDVDVAKRLGERGRLLYVPSARFEHLGGASFARWDRAEGVRSLLHGMTQYAAVHFPPAQRVLFGLLLVLASLPRIVVFSRWKRDLAAVYRAALGAAGALVRGRDVPALAGPR